MTPKEKAKELIAKFSIAEFEYKPISKRFTAKQCAYITIDEMLKNAGFIWGGRDTETGLSSRDEYRKYWNGVKQEIEKL